MNRCCTVAARALLLAGVSALCPASPVSAQPQQAAPVYDAARGSLIQIRTLLASSGRQSSLGSGFVVDRGAQLAVTNYHVVSQAAHEPSTYRLQYLDDGQRSGNLRIVALDLANDLAVVQLADAALPSLGFDREALDGTLPQGTRLYAMGNPLDLGFTIVEGTYNGPVERSVQPRLHFTGAINPGMSGGPAVNAGGAVVGINVSKRLDGELLSFLVPASAAAALLEQARQAPLAADTVLRDEIARQFRERQRRVADTLLAAGFKIVPSGDYQGAEPLSSWFECWSSTDADEQPPPRVLTDRTDCHADASLFLSDELQPGTVSLTRRYLRSERLNAFQFSAALSRRYNPSTQRGPMRDDLTAPHCSDRFVQAGPEMPVLRASWCAAAYLDYQGIYTMQLLFVTQDQPDAALLTELELDGFEYQAGLDLGRALIEATGWRE